MQFVIIGNLVNRRVISFCDAAEKLGYGKTRIITYESWLSGNKIPPIKKRSILKIDSPGENDEVRQLLIARGLKTSACQPYGYGEIKYMVPCYDGFCDWLDECAMTMQEMPVRLMNSGPDIQLQFDKPHCQQWLEERGVAVPRRMVAVAGYDDLLAKMNQSGLKKVFIKPAHASSASGVIAFRKSGQRVQAVSSAEMVKEAGELRVFNSLKVRTYTSETEVAALVDRLAVENIFAEEWLPKPMLSNRYFDIRILVIDGRARHTVIRTSGHIITNLHLGNRRGDFDEFIEKIGTEKWESVQAMAEKTAACFPHSLYMGVDLLLTADLQKVYVLEVNAFGDLLPGVLHEGETCYEAQINAMIKKCEEER